MSPTAGASDDQPSNPEEPTPADASTNPSNDAPPLSAERPTPQPGLHYSLIRHLTGLGPPPLEAQHDADWGVNEFVHPVRAQRKVDTAAMDGVFRQACTPDAPDITELRRLLVASARRAHVDDVKVRRACPRRSAVEEEIRSRAEDP